jgi:hypothetical protein
LLGSGHVVFPRPEADHLLSIKLGGLSYQRVAEEIENLLSDVESAAQISTLSEAADRRWIDDFVASTHRCEILNTPPGDIKSADCYQ